MKHEDGLHFRMEVALDNAAFVNEDGTLNHDELSRIVGDVVFDVTRGFNDAHLFDTNGNRVGEWSISTCTCTSTTDDAFDGTDANCPVHGIDAENARDNPFLDCDDDDCPKGDPDCLARADECHDACESPDTSIPSALTLQPGARVMFVRNVERFPHAFVERGTMGTLVQNDEEMLVVHLDDYFDGLDEWDNCIIWTPDDGDRTEWLAPDGDIAIIEANRRTRRVEMIVHPEEGGYVRTLITTERPTPERLEFIRHALMNYDDGIYVATDGWMLESWGAMYHAFKGKVLDYTDDEILAARIALAHISTFSARKIAEYQAARKKYRRPKIYPADPNFPF